MKIKTRISSITAALVVFALIMGSCMKHEDLSIREQADIQDFITKNPNLHFTQKESGLYYFEVTPGTGDALNPHDTAFVIYTGMFLNGSVFDSNVGSDTFYFPVGESDKQWVIPGFDEGISYMKKGSKSILLIPSSLGYGHTGFGYISGYTPLLFEVTLGRIKRGPAK